VRQSGRADIHEQTFELCNCLWNVMQVTICQAVAWSASPVVIRSEVAHCTGTAEKWELHRPGRLGTMDINGMEQR
jgi:hypothetical protein